MEQLLAQLLADRLERDRGMSGPQPNPNPIDLEMSVDEIDMDQTTDPIPPPRDDSTVAGDVTGNL